ncbi:unnamed protein product [Soboliphyme baturini]|uniref:F-BAR domain-containing protein n=1 Tax=Soboliphyme baturini TaxID=241478 RepID=A0A183J5P2_9BILA|nr:unnamed protein product [Soboliphyme baturini]
MARVGCRRKLNEINKLDQCWAQSRSAVYKAKKEYFKTAKDAEAAKMNISRSQQAEAAKSSYAKQVQEANDYQHKYLTDLLPEVLEALCELDSSRVMHVQRLLKKCIEIERSVLPVMEKCLDDMMNETDRINPAEDCEAVVERYRTGYGLPDDISFHEYSAEGCSTTSASELSNGASQTISAESWSQGDLLSRKETRNLHRALSGRKKGTFRKIFRSRTEDYSKNMLEDLPPLQQCKRLEFLLADCKKQLKNRLEMKDGLIKLQTAYSETPKFGSAAEVQTNLESCESEINVLSMELQRLEVFAAII